MSKSDKARFNLELDIETHNELLAQAEEKRTTKVGVITQLINEEKKRSLKNKKHVS